MYRLVSTCAGRFSKSTWPVSLFSSLCKLYMLKPERLYIEVYGENISLRVFKLVTNQEAKCNLNKTELKCIHETLCSNRMRAS